MKKTIRMTLSVLLAVLLIFGALPFAASAADNSGTCGSSGVFWEFNSGTGTLRIYSNDNSGKAMSDYSATKDPEWVNWSDSITKIEVEKVTKLGNYAFYGLNNLTSVEFKDELLEHIGTYEFSFCSSLTELTFPRYLDSIGQHSFKSSGLQKLTFTGNTLSSAGSGTRQAFRSHSEMTVCVPKGFKLNGKEATLSSYGSEPFYKNYINYTDDTDATVYWKDSDGSLLKVETVAVGTTPDYGDEPTGSDGVSVFDKWTPEVTEAAANTAYVYNANYVLPKYTVTWANYDGTVLKTDEEVEYGSTPSYTGETPVKHNDNPETYYAFDGWSDEMDSDDLVEIEDEEVTNDITYFAHFTETDKDPVSYVNANGEPQPQLTGYEKLTDDLPTYELEANDVDWLIVVGEVTVNEHIKMNGDFNLLLCDGATLTVPRGISLKDDSSLTIWRQEDGTGSLVIDGSQVDENNAGIGNVNWHNNVKITINGGVLDVKGGQDGAGIGGAANGTAEVEINGGEITAKGGRFGAGIGGGSNSSATVTINDGTITASGSEEGGAGIGAGDYSSKAGNVTINGGTVTATGGHTGSGIGGGENGGGNVTINGGTVTATGGKCGAGIGSGYFERTDGYNNRSTTVTITGGEVTATGGDTDTGVSGNFYKNAGAGIGAGGKDQNNISINISGGTIVATKGAHSGSMQGSNGVGIGSSYSASVSAISLAWDDDSKDSMSITSDSYSGTVSFASKFKDENHPSDTSVYEAETTVSGDTIPDDSKLTPATATDWEVLAYLFEYAFSKETITLEKDYKADSDDKALTVPSGRTVTLDLNGHTIDRNLKRRGDGSKSSVIRNYGTLTIIDSSDGGVIKGGNTDNHGGGAVYNEGTLTINGGTFTGNKAYRGGAIYNEGMLTINGGTFTENTAYGNPQLGGGAIYNGGTLNLCGGTITGNTSETTNGGGIFTHDNGTINISGRPVVKNNTAKGENNDVYLKSGQKLNVTGALDSTAKIGVREQSKDTGNAFTSGLNGNDAEPNGTVDNFFSNYSGYGITLDADGEACSEDKGTFQISIEETKYGTVTANKGSARENDTVTLTVTPEDAGGSIKSVTVKDREQQNVELTDNGNGEYSFTMPADDVTVSAEFKRAPIEYVDANGTPQEPLTDYTVVDATTDTMTDGWYVLISNINIDILDRVSVSGDVNLLLCDHAELKLNKGISVNSGNTLTIWQQENGTGTMNAYSEADSYNAAIGSDSMKTSGYITINGGVINATGTKYSAGIGSGNRQPAKTITINGGTVTAKGGYHAAAIGGGTQALSTVVINGGTVNATGGEGGAGIGAGYNNPYVSGTSLSITINDGTITATGGSGAAAIGTGAANTNYSSCSIGVNGGTVKALSGGINSRNYNGSKQGSIDLNWTDDVKDTMSVYSTGYNGSVTMSNMFKDDNGKVYDIGTVDDLTTLAGTTIRPYESIITYHSLTLKGDIGVNYYLNLSSEQLAQGVTVDFTWNGKSDYATINSNSMAETRDVVAGLYKATCYVCAAEMNDEITASITIGDNSEPIETEIYKVRDYADVIIANADDNYSEELITLVKTMLNYGAGAQTQFNHNTDHLANDGIGYNLAALTDDEIRDIDRDVPDKESMNLRLANAGIEYYGYSLILKTKTTLRFYFKKGSADYNKLVLLDTDDVNVGTVHNYNDQYCYIEVSDVPASRLDDLYELKYDDISLGGFSALSYVKDVLLNDNGDQPITDTVTALYRYNEAAVAYFNSIQGGGQ